VIEKSSALAFVLAGGAAALGAVAVWVMVPREPEKIEEAAT
jgi:hypothetical protein